MSTELRVVTLRNPCLILPQIPEGFTFEKPERTLLMEAPDYDYTDAELRDLALASSNLFMGLVLDPIKVAQYPEGYLLSLYLNIRYANPPMSVQCPVRQADRLILNQHTFGDLCLLIGVLSRIYLIQQKSIDKSIQLKVVNTFRLLQRCCYGVYETLQRFSQFETADNYVFAQQTFVGTAGEEDTVLLYVDLNKHQAWLDAGHTEEELIEWWLANATDPVA